MDLWTKFACRIVGWNYSMLKECSEASRKALHRYVGAVILMMLIWAFIGFCMAQRYFDLNSTGAIITGAIFAIVILLIERQIILIVGKSKLTMVFRGVLAMCMALIGATVIDQYMFGKDIEAQMSAIVEERAEAQFFYRKQVVEQQRILCQHELDSLNIVASQLSEEIAKRPVVTTTIYNRQPTGQVDSLGRPVMAVGYQQSTIPSPKQKDLERVVKRIEVLQVELNKHSEKLHSLREDLVAENRNNIGLLTELDVTFSDKVIFSSWASAIFYLGVFVFFLMIELLIVSGKWSSQSKCDYEAMVEAAQETNIKRICAVTESYNEKMNSEL
ncbi:MAG: DUF4407 domain-containing protein [Alistipes sp.]|nr:DUF4407 domain-containing protein [Alistipes sp.]